MTFSLRHTLLFSLTLAAAAAPVTTARAQEWRNYSAQGKLYSLSFPEAYEAKDETYLRIDDRFLLGTNEIVAATDKRPYTSANKYYILKFAQTLGTPLTPDQRKRLIAREIDSYIQHYTSLKGVVIDMTPDAPQGENAGSFVTIGFEDPGLGPQVFKTHVVATDHSLFQHIVIGAERDIKAQSTDEAFRSLIASDGVFRNNGSVRGDWEDYTSPLGIFTAYFPAATKPFLPKDPEVSNNGKVDRLSARLYDPVWKQSVFVNIYGYELDRPIGKAEADIFLQERFVLRYPALSGSVVTRQVNGLAFPAFNTTFSIKPPEGFEYMDTVRLRVLYGRNYIMAYEVRGSAQVVSGPIFDSLIRQAQFTPAEAQKRLETGQAEPGQAETAPGDNPPEESAPASAPQPEPPREQEPQDQEPQEQDSLTAEPPPP